MHWWRELRMAIQSTQSDCNRKRCRYYPGLCFLHGVRRRALSANIVVTNHALLFRDVIAQGGILPPIRYWIVDEAHSAESEARKQLTEGASHSELCALLGTLHGKRGGLLSALRRRLSEDEDATPTLLVRKLTEEVSRAATLTDSLFDFVKDLAPLAADSDYDAAELWVNPGVRETGPWGVVESTGRSLAKRLEAILAHGRDLVTWLESAGPDFAEAKADLAGLVTRLWEQYAGLVAVIDGEDESLVYSASLNRRRTVDAEKLAAARLYVGEVLADDLYPRVRSVVFTSATIAAGASFDHFARGVGFNLLPDGSWESLRLASSYDFERQMTVFVATDIAEPNTTGYLGELESLLEGVHVAMGGSVLTLFTNRRDMERLHAVLEPRLKHRGLDLIVQRRGTSAKRLRDEFIADKSLSMFALKSFWEGFDAKGDTLRCVIVPKLPFGRPTDPLSRERECREGAVAWRRYVLPEAVLELKQAAGRLIRSSTDTGCLVLADARITTKRYGREFLDALPVDDVEALPAEKIAEQIAQRFGS
jgi:ATP-dependent DNA helicase DinG